MAYVNPDQIVPGQPTPQAAPVAAGGAGAAGGATKQAASTPGLNVPQQPSAQLSAYLGANQQQAEKFAGDVAGNLSNQVQAAGAGIQPAVNTYTGGLYNVPTNAEANQAVATNPSKLTPEQTAAYKQELGAAQKAPNSANTFETTAPYQDLTRNIQKTVEQTSLWNSGNNPATLSTALAPFESPSATTGESTLDALLLSQTPGAYRQIQQAIAPAANLQGQLGAATSQANEALRAAIAQDQAATQAAQAAPQTYANNLSSYLNSALEEARQKASTSQAGLLADIKKNTLTPEDLAALGITAEQAKQLNPNDRPDLIRIPENPFQPHVNLEDYLSQTPVSNIGIPDVASEQNYADVAALQSLLGGNAPVTPLAGTTRGAIPALNTFNYPAAQAAFNALPPPPAPPPPPEPQAPRPWYDQAWESTKKGINDAMPWNWAEGGEIPERPKNLKEYMGATK